MAHEKLVNVINVNLFHTICKAFPSCPVYTYKDDKIACQCLVLLTVLKFWE